MRSPFRRRWTSRAAYRFFRPDGPSSNKARRETNAPRRNPRPSVLGIWSGSRRRRGRRPGGAQPGADVDAPALRRRRRRAGGGVAVSVAVSSWRRRAIEPVEDRVGDEARARREDVAIAEAALLANEETQGMDQHQRALGPGHRHVKQAALLFDLLGLAGRQVGGDATVSHIENRYAVPFLPFGRMDRRQDQVVLVEVRLPRLGPRRLRRIERQVGEKTLARGGGRRQLLELLEIAEPHAGVVVESLEVRLVPTADETHLGRAGNGGRQLAKQIGEGRPVGAR